MTHILLARYYDYQHCPAMQALPNNFQAFSTCGWCPCHHARTGCHRITAALAPWCCLPVLLSQTSCTQELFYLQMSESHSAWYRCVFLYHTTVKAIRKRQFPPELQVTQMQLAVLVFGQWKYGNILGSRRVNDVKSSRAAKVCPLLLLSFCCLNV